jgi:hypothetical protein
MLVYKSGLLWWFQTRWSRNIKKELSQNIATQAEVDEIQLLLMETINQTESDLENKIFTNYQEYPSAGIVLKKLLMRLL